MHLSAPSAYFNPRSHEGSDDVLEPTIKMIMEIFQSTLPRRERPAFIISVDQTLHISIHAPTKGATYETPSLLHYSRFQSTLPRRERHNTAGAHTARCRFQSTLPRRERPFHLQNRKENQTISIHAPTKGATQRYTGLSGRQAISIHAPTKGATSIYARRRWTYKFQSTLPRRERHCTRI